MLLVQNLKKTQGSDSYFSVEIYSSLKYVTGGNLFHASGKFRGI